MKVGSLVECIRPYNNVKAEFPHLNVPIKGEHYTIRGFSKPTPEEIIEYGLTSAVYVYLEEIINAIQSDGITTREPAFQIRSFREIELPPLIEAEIKEILTVHNGVKL